MFALDIYERFKVCVQVFGIQLVDLVDAFGDFKIKKIETRQRLSISLHDLHKVRRYFSKNSRRQREQEGVEKHRCFLKYAFRVRFVILSRREYKFHVTRQRHSCLFLLAQKHRAAASVNFALKVHYPRDVIAYR